MTHIFLALCGMTDVLAHRLSADIAFALLSGCGTPVSAGGDSWNIGSLWRTIFLGMVFASMVAIVWAYAEVVNNLSRAQKNVTQLSLHATTDRYKEPSSAKQQQRSSADTLDEERSTSLSTTKHLKPNQEAGLPMSPLDQPTTPSGIYSVVQEAPSEPANGLVAPKQRGSRRDSLWRRIILGSIMEGSEGSASPDSSRRRDVFENSSKSSTSSSVPYTRSNSNISVKDWLWSASRDTGFFYDVESLGEFSEEEEECKNVLWLNGMASPEKRRLSSAIRLRECSAPTATSPESLATSKETRRSSSSDSSVGGGAVVVPQALEKGDDATYESSASSMRTPTMKWKSLFRNVTTNADIEAAASTAALEPFPLPRPLHTVEHAATASFHSHVGGDVCSPASSLALGRAGSHIKDPVVADTTARSERSKSNPVGTTIVTPQNLIRSRFGHGVDRARGYVIRMSSLDTSHGSVGYGNGVALRGGRHDPADKGGRRGGKMPSEQATLSTPTATATGAAEQHLRTKQAPGKDMDRFISRIKW